MRVGEAGRGQGEQSQYPGGGGGQGGVHEAEDAAERGALVALRRGAAWRGRRRPAVGRAASQPPARFSAAGWPWHASTSCSAERGSTVMRTEPVYRVEEFEGGLGVQAAEGAGADVRDAGERARRRRRRAGTAGSRAAPRRPVRRRPRRRARAPPGGPRGPRAASFAEIVRAGPGRGRQVRARSSSSRAVDSVGTGGAVGFGEPGSQYAVGVFSRATCPASRSASAVRPDPGGRR